jgi:integrase
MGELRKRGSIWWLRYYRDGRRYEESSKSTSYEEARDLLKVKEADIAKGLPVTPAIGRFTFDDAARDLVTNYEINGKRSLVHLKRRIEAGLRPYFRGRRLANISSAHVRDYSAKRLAAGAARATINRELAALKRMFTLAMQDGKVLRRPYIPLLQEDNTRRGFFERAQFDAVRAQLPARLKPVATFAYYTGWRTISEILPLQWHQVDLAAGTVRLEAGMTKNRKGRTFIFSGLIELREMLEAQEADRQRLAGEGVICPWVFHRKNGTQIKSFRKAWTTACTKAGCPGRIPHDFRRTAVRNLMRAGVPDSVAMKMTGHLTRAVFDRYDITLRAGPGGCRAEATGTQRRECLFAAGTICRDNRAEERDRDQEYRAEVEADERFRD